VATNVPGNLRKRNLPLGMAIRFLGLTREAEGHLLRFTAERAGQLVI
jgi:hypothetical protein